MSKTTRKSNAVVHRPLFGTYEVNVHCVPHNVYVCVYACMYRTRCFSGLKMTFGQPTLLICSLRRVKKKKTKANEDG